MSRPGGNAGFLSDQQVDIIAKRLAERTDANRDAIREAKLGCETPSLWSHHPERMSLININQRSVAVGYFGNLFKWRQVTVQAGCNRCGIQHGR